MTETKPLHRELRPTKAMLAAKEQLAKATTGPALLRAILSMLTAPCSKEYVPVEYDKFSGKAISWKWVVRKESKLMQFVYFYDTYSAANGVELTPKANLLLKELVPRIDHRQLLFRVPKDDDAGFYYISVEVDRLQTGGGHNDSPTYANALVFKIAHPAKL